MISREYRWYWVKWPNENKWSVAQYIGRAGERQMWSSGDIIQSDAPREIGPRIPTPDEPWDIAPATNLAKLIAEKQAEALEEAAKLYGHVWKDEFAEVAVGIMRKGRGYIYPEGLIERADELRRQAVENSNG